MKSRKSFRRSNTLGNCQALNALVDTRIPSQRVRNRSQRGWSVGQMMQNKSSNGIQQFLYLGLNESDLPESIQSKILNAEGCSHVKKLKLEVPILICSIVTVDEMLGFHRVLQTLVQPWDIQENGPFDCELKPRVSGIQWAYDLVLSPGTTDALWKFTKNIMLRLQSLGISSLDIQLPQKKQYDMRWLTGVNDKNCSFCNNLSTDIVELKQSLKCSMAGHQLMVKTENNATPSFIAHLPLSTRKPRNPLQQKDLEQFMSKIVDGKNTPRAVIILRGIPGSGKSSLTSAIQSICSAQNITCAHFSADSYFDTPRGYCFDVSLLSNAHETCKANVKKAISKKSAQIIIVDNTNTQKWEYNEYEKMASSFNWTVHIIEVHCPDILVAMQMGSRNTHGVAIEKVLSMYLRWEQDDRALRLTPKFHQSLVNKNPSLSSFGKVSFVGLFLDQKSRDEIIRMLPPIHINTFVDHVTLFYHPTQLYTSQVLFGQSYRITPHKIADDTKGRALAVTLDPKLHLKCANQVPHITISTAAGTPAAYSNKLLEDKNNERSQLPETASDLTIEAKLGTMFLVNQKKSLVLQPPFPPCNCSDKEDTRYKRTLVVLVINDLEIDNVIRDKSPQSLARKEVEHVANMRKYILDQMGSSCIAHRVLCIRRTRPQQVSCAHTTPNHYLELAKQLSSSSLDYLSKQVKFHDFIALSIENEEEEFTTLMRTKQKCFHTQAVRIFATDCSLVSWKNHLSMTDENVSISFQLLDFKTKQCFRDPGYETFEGAMESWGIGFTEETNHVVCQAFNLIEKEWAAFCGIEFNPKITRIDCSTPVIPTDTVEVVLSVSQEYFERFESPGFIMKAFYDKLQTVGGCHVCMGHQADGLYFRACTLAEYTPLFYLRLAAPASLLDKIFSKRAVYCTQQQHKILQSPSMEYYTLFVLFIQTLLKHVLQRYIFQHDVHTFSMLLSEQVVLMFLEHVNFTRTIDDEFRIITLRKSIALMEYLCNFSKEQWCINLKNIHALIYETSDIKNNELCEALYELFQSFQHSVSMAKKSQNTENASLIYVQNLLTIAKQSSLSTKQPYPKCILENEKSVMEMLIILDPTVINDVELASTVLMDLLTVTSKALNVFCETERVSWVHNYLYCWVTSPDILHQVLKSVQDKNSQFVVGISVSVSYLC